jgi:hypothetical protein
MEKHTMLNFANLKNNSINFDRLNKEIGKMNSPVSEKKAGDDRYWKLDRDKSGNGSAVIRFLPSAAVDGEDGMPWVRFFDHGFKGPTGKWYIEKSLTSLGDGKPKDPVGEYNSFLWKQSESDLSWQRKQAREQKRRLHYVSNILVISDPKHPENEGGVFLFTYGKKIFDKIVLAMNPEFEGDPQINPFHLWKGANLKLRIRTEDGYPNYNASLFDAPSAVSDDDDKIEAIWKREYSLTEIIAPSEFKSYAELKSRLDMVLEDDPAYQSFVGGAAPVQSRTAPAASSSAPVPSASSASWNATDDEDDDLQAFKNLALS